MIFGNAAWGFRKTPLEKQLEITHNMGLNLLELQIGGHPNDFLQLDSTDEDILKVKNLFDQYNIKRICASTGNDFTSADENECLATMENVKKAINIAGKLRFKYIRIFAGFSPVEEVTGARWDRMIKMLNEVLKYGAEHNVLPAIETHGGVEEYLDGIRHFNSTTTVKEKLGKLFSELEYPAGIVFDPANLGAVGIDENEIISLYKDFLPKISYFHLKDFSVNPSGADSPSACGEGRLNWNIIWDVLKNSSCPSMLEYELTEDIEDGLKRSLEHCK